LVKSRSSSSSSSAGGGAGASASSSLGFFFCGTIRNHQPPVQHAAVCGCGKERAGGGGAPSSSSRSQTRLRRRSCADRIGAWSEGGVSGEWVRHSAHIAACDASHAALCAGRILTCLSQHTDDQGADWRGLAHPPARHRSRRKNSTPPGVICFLSFPPIPRLGSLFPFFLAHWHEMKRNAATIYEICLIAVWCTPSERGGVCPSGCRPSLNKMFLYL